MYKNADGMRHVTDGPQFSDSQLLACISQPVRVKKKTVLAVSGYVEVYDFIKSNYNDLNKKQLAWRQISAAPEALGKPFSSMVT